jgi:hypothetical protein
MASVKFSDIVGNYVDYNTTGEFSVWVEKLELVAQLQDIRDKLKFLPLFLSGPAFAVYQQLADDVKADYAKLKKELTTAFSTNAFASYEQLRNRVLADGESVDVYLADLRRLVNLMGQTNADPLLRCAFVAGLPADVALQLKSTVDAESMNLAELVSKARAMLASKGDSAGYVCAGVRQDSKTSVRPDSKAIQCYKCSGRGHMARDCPTDRVAARQNRVRKCYMCDATDHLVYKCPQRTGNGNGGVSAPDAHPAKLQ